MLKSVSSGSQFSAMGEDTQRVKRRRVESTGDSHSMTADRFVEIEVRALSTGMFLERLSLLTEVSAVLVVDGQKCEVSVWSKIWPNEPFEMALTSPPCKAQFTVTSSDRGARIVEAWRILKQAVGVYALDPEAVKNQHRRVLMWAACLIGTEGVQ